MALDLSVEHQTKVDLRTIIEQNLSLIHSRERWGMKGHILQESWGGNAGLDENGRPRVAANFLYNPHNGKIRLFGNLGSCGEWDDLYHRGYYRKGTFVLSRREDGQLQISTVYGIDSLAEEAKKNILKSAGSYNRQR